MLRFRTSAPRDSIAARTCAALLLLAPVASADVVNGDLEGSTGMGAVPPGWMQYQGNSSDTADESGPFGTYNLSPNGGTFVRGFSVPPEHFQFSQREGIEQDVEGLSPGVTYDLSFWQSSVNGISSTSGLPFSGDTGYWELLVDGELVDASTPMDPPAGTSLDNVWNEETLGFTATAASHLITLRVTVPENAVEDSKTFMLIDGLALLVSVPVTDASWAQIKSSFGER